MHDDAERARARPPRAMRLAAWFVLAGAGGAALALLLWPNGEQVRELHLAIWVRLWRAFGAPDWFTPEVSEQIANSVILLVPMAAATVLAWRVRWWWVLLAGSLVGVGIELAQWLVLPSRVPSPVDAFWNAVGAAVGVAAGAWLREARR